MVTRHWYLNYGIQLNIYNFMSENRPTRGSSVPCLESTIVDSVIQGMCQIFIFYFLINHYYFSVLLLDESEGLLRQGLRLVGSTWRWFHGTALWLSSASSPPSAAPRLHFAPFLFPFPSKISFRPQKRALVVEFIFLPPPLGPRRVIKSCVDARASHALCIQTCPGQ